MADKLPWDDCARYMTALHALQRWVERELNQAQLDQVVSPTLPAEWCQVEKLRGELLNG